MRVYLDYVFIENFCMILVILLETAYLIRRKPNKLRLILSSITSSLYVCIILVLRIKELDYVISKMLLNIIVIYIAFKIRNLKEYIKILAIFYAVTSVNIGANIFISQMLNIPVNNLKSKVVVYGGGMLASYLIFKWLWKTYKNNITEKIFLYKVIVKIGTGSFKYTGFLDTGNSLKDILNNKYVLFAKKKNNIEKYIDKKDFIEVDVITIGKRQKKSGVIVKGLEIEINNKIYTSDAVIVFDSSEIWKNKNFDMILNYELVKEMGGIEI